MWVVQRIQIASSWTVATDQSLHMESGGRFFFFVVFSNLDASPRYSPSL